MGRRHRRLLGRSSVSPTNPVKLMVSPNDRRELSELEREKQKKKRKDQKKSRKKNRR